jgi:hypothetical protein
VGREEVLEAARRFGETPFILKPNRGGKGLGVQLVASLDALAAILEAPGESAPIDGVWLIQDYVRPERPVITRYEFIGGRFLYAVEVDASQGFELCPADVCATDAPAATPKFRILDCFEHPILARYEAFLAENGIEVAGIEHIRRADGELVTYDVNTNTNYNPEAEAAAGLFGMRELARFLGGELATRNARAA